MKNLIPALICLFLVVPSQAGTITVCWDGSGDHLTIQAGINAASDGDEVVVCDGVFTGTDNRDIDFKGKAITVRSENGPENCIIDCNGTTSEPHRGFYFHNGEDTNSVLDGFCITGGYVYVFGGGGIYCEWFSSPTITNCTISGNAAHFNGGGIYCQAGSSPIITNCMIISNACFDGGGGGGINLLGGSPTITNCTISGNTAYNISGPFAAGGGIYCSDSNLKITNCTISGNSAAGAFGRGGGMFNWQTMGVPIITNCTFTGNSAGNRGGGMYNDNIHPTMTPIVTNCILWDNSDRGGQDESAQIDGDAPVINYCCVQGWTGSLDGTGNIGDNPMFVNPDGGDDIPGTEDDNLRLLFGSPCIDIADNNAVTVPTDRDGNPRIQNDIVDMGAYEGGHPPERILTVSSTSGGSVIEPGEGVFEYTPMEVVPIDANDADLYYHFVEWTGTAVDAGRVADPCAASTTVTMGADYTLVANFAIDQRILTVSSTSGGSVIEPGEGSFDCDHGQVAIVADADLYYHFVEWTGTAVDAGRVADPYAASTTVMMDANYTVVANFAFKATTIFHVDVNAPGPTHDGRSWATAYQYLQDALNDPCLLPADEVWVAKGTYKPAEPGGSRSTTFQLKNAVLIKGGYAGYSEPDPNLRDIDEYNTTLSGDLNGDDVGFTNNGENSYHVVTGNGTNNTAILDGFTITAGNADGSWPNNAGAGMFNDSSSPTVSNCTFSGNEADYGGGMGDVNSSPILTNCTFSENAAGSGGGMYNLDYSSPTLTNCTFSGNTADRGGGMCNWDSSPTLTNCIIIGNTANVHGAGIYCDDSDPNLSNCTIIGNTANSDGGGLANCDGPITNCTIIGNTANSDGGGLAQCDGPITNCTIMCNSANYNGGGIDDCDGSIKNCILWGNYPDEIASSSAAVTYSNVRGGWEDHGNIDADPLLTPDGHLRASSPCIDSGDPNFIIDSNETDIDGEDRINNDIVDMGADEFIDTDTDSLPDFWEQKYFGGPTIAEPNADPDLDAHTNLTEYGLYSSDPNVAAITYYVDTNQPDDSGDGLSWPTAKRTIQAGINLAVNSDKVIVAPGIYTGLGNYNLDPNGRQVVIRSTDPTNPGVVATTVINPNQEGRGFYFGNYENAGCVVSGFTITNGYSTGNWPETGGAGIHCYGSSPTITYCTIRGNEADFGGGIFCRFYSSPTISNCTISGNSADFCGGMFNYESSPTLTNCAFTGNSAYQSSGGMGNGASSVVLTNCTFTGNSAGQDAGGIDNFLGSTLILTNCILWGDTASVGNEIDLEIGSTVDVSYCDVEGGQMGVNVEIGSTLNWGVGNIDTDPRFVNPGHWDNNDTPGDTSDDFWVDGDYHLKSEGWRWDMQRKVWTWDDVTSRCIDAGNPGSPVGEEPLTIPDDPNNEWGENLRINMGAFGGTAEASMPPYDWALLADLTNDGTVNFEDYAAQAIDWLESVSEQPGDLNRNGTVDIADLALLTEDWLEQTSWYVP